MTGATRRCFQAQMTLKYWQGNARQAERVSGWGRDMVQLALHAFRTGVICLGAQEAYCGKPRWEEMHPEVANSSTVNVDIANRLLMLTTS